MDIRPVSAAYGAKPVQSVPKKNKKSAPDDKSVVAKGEQVEFSDASKNMQKLKAIADETPDVRIELVEEIKTKIKYNGYPVESSFYRALEKMVDNRMLL